MKKAMYIYSALVFVSVSVHAHSNDRAIEHLMSLSLEELSMLNVEMGTATKSVQRLADIPSSVYVLDSERIIRSGARSIPEALSLVPGLHVSKFSGTEWVVSARGFHDGLFNKQLVLVDGRSIYNPIYGGVYWADIDYVLEDIDRIEVLRGPGAALWGGNAVNGVINIITKSAMVTQGSYVAGTWAQGGGYDTSVRHGLQLNDSTYARAFYKKRQLQYDRYNSSPNWTLQTAGIVAESEREHDAWSFRLGGEQLTYKQRWWQVHYLNGYLNSVDEQDVSVDSHSFYTQFNADIEFSNQHTGNYQFWFERNTNHLFDAAGIATTVDLDVTQNYQLQADHLITYGGGYRLVEVEFLHAYDNLDLNNLPYYVLTANDVRDVDSIVNVFAQSEIEWGNHWKTVVGLKAEYFEHTSETELSPQIRGLYSNDDSHTFWLGVGKASAAPSYGTTNTHFVMNVYSPEQNRYFVEVTTPELEMKPERVTTYELGYRFSYDECFEIDSTLFYSQHEYVRGRDAVRMDGYPDHAYGVSVTDDYSLDTQGFELSGVYLYREDLRFYLNYSFFRAQGHWDTGDSSNGSSVDWYNIDAQHTASLQTLWNITEQWKLDIIVRAHSIEYAERFNDISGYAAIDARLAWQANPQAPRLEFILQNIGEKDGYRTDWISTTNQQAAVVKASYEF